MSRHLNLLLIEAHYGGSHQSWANEYRRFSRHHIDLLSLPAQFWKWRMQGGAITLARLFTERDERPDLILATEMFDLSLFRALTRSQTHDLPIALYFHENQLTYPQNSRQRHGWQYAFINYASALVADHVFFSSVYHMQSFFEELPRMLKHFADFNELQTVEELRAKSSVMPVGVDLRRLDAFRLAKCQDASPLILWNHRWEEDKNPPAFLDALYKLADEGFDFRVALVGENVRQQPAEFEAARDRLGDRVIQYGYLPDFADYARLLWQSDYAISTAYQEFFGIATVQAIYCGCVPLLPRRLNYPYLVPEKWHSTCLFPEGKLVALLRHHLSGRLRADVPALQKHVAQFDWATLVDTYDDALEGMIR